MNSIFVKPEELTPSTNYFLRIKNIPYDVVVILEVEFIKIYYGSDMDENDTREGNEIPFEESPYCYFTYYEDADVFGMFRVVNVVETKNISIPKIEKMSLADLPEGDTTTNIKERNSLSALYTQTGNSTQEYFFKNFYVPGELIWVFLGTLKATEVTIIKTTPRNVVFTETNDLQTAIFEYLTYPTEPTIEKWDVSGITNMAYIFSYYISTKEANDLLAGIERWNVSNVTNMAYMFSNSRWFNQPLNRWNVSAVVDARNMFERCVRFNKPLDNWKLPVVENISYMFYRCDKFDQDLNSWEILTDPTILKMDHAFDGTRLKKRNHYPSWYVPPSSEVDEYLIEEASIPAHLPTENPELVVKFLDTYRDYTPFIDFINSYLRVLSPNEYRVYYSNLSPFYFMRDAPMAYRIMPTNIPPHILNKNPDTRFYNAMIYVFSQIPHFNPSSINHRTISVHSYMVHLNRLIYYYNVFNAIRGNELNPFNSAAVFIFAHGSLLTFNDTRTLEDPHFEGTLKNIFICTKSSLGCYEYDIIEGYLKDVAENGGMLDDMYDSLHTHSSIPFDELIYKYHGTKMPDNFSGNNKAAYHQIGSQMQNYISPNTTGYINKVYNGGMKDDMRCFVIDVELFHKNKDSYSDPIDKLMAANILMDPDFNKRSITIQNEKIVDFKIQLVDIVNYYSRVKRKENLFIYDNSCSILDDSDHITSLDSAEKHFSSTLDISLRDKHPFVEKMENVTKTLGRRGWGVRRKTKIRRMRSTRNQKEIRIIRQRSALYLKLVVIQNKLYTLHLRSSYNNNIGILYDF